MGGWITRCVIILGLGAAGAAEAGDGWLRTTQPFPAPVGPGSVDEHRYETNLLELDAPDGIVLSLPDGLFTAERTELVRRTDGWSWFGRVHQSWSVVLTRHRDALAGLVQTPWADYELTGGPDGEARIALIDADLFPPCADPVEVATQAEPPTAAAPSPVGPDPIALDVMVVYTPAARRGAGGTSQIEATIRAAVDITNTAYANSQVGARLDLVHIAETPFDDTRSASNDLNNVRTSTTVAAWRNTQGADMVGLIVDRNDACGLGYVQRRVRSSFAPFAYQVTARGCAVGNLSFAHEFGHNQGCEHDPANGTSPSNASFPFAFGHFHSGAYRTVMSYSNQCTGGCRRAPYFSNPGISHQNRATGITDQRENHRTITLTAPVVTDFRPPAVELALRRDQVQVVETSTGVRLQVTRSGLADREVTVSYTTVSDSATEGADFVAAAGTLTWSAGDTSDKPIDIQLSDDRQVEGPEHFNLYLHAPRGAALGPARTATITIQDFEAGAVQIIQAQPTREDAGAFEIRLGRSGGSEGAVSVAYALEEESATAGADYVDASGTVQWADGDASPVTLTIPVLDDRTIEGEETLLFRLSQPTGDLRVDNPSARLRIQDWEEGGLDFEVAAASIREDEGSLGLRIDRSGGTDGVVEARVRVEELEATDGIDFALVIDTARFEPGVTTQFVQLDAIDDREEEADESVRLVIEPVSGNPALGTVAATTVTIEDWEPGQVQFEASTYLVSEDAGRLSVFVTRAGGSDGPASVELQPVEGTAEAGFDFELAPTPVQWADGESGPREAVVTILDDRVEEGEERFSVQIQVTDPATELGSLPGAEVRLLDYEEGAVDLVQSELTTTELGGSAALTLERTGGSDGEVVVGYMVRGLDGADPALDLMTTTKGTVVFDAGEVGPARVELGVVDDAIGEPTERFRIDLAIESGGAELLAETATLTVEDAGAGSFTVISPAPDGTVVGLTESEGTTELVVERSGEIAGPATLRYRFESDSAELGRDLIATDGELIWTAGEQGPRTLVVEAVDDQMDEVLEILTLVMEVDEPGAFLEQRWTIEITDAPPEGGCGCSTSAPSTESHPVFGLLLLLALAVGRRPR